MENLWFKDVIMQTGIARKQENIFVCTLWTNKTVIPENTSHPNIIIIVRA